MAKILIVDDEPEIVKILIMRMVGSGYEAISAGDGLTAIEKARKESPDLILLDVRLPKLDGHKVCKMLKSDAKFCKIPIILLTASTQESDRKLGEEAGADGFMPKPFDSKALMEMVNALLKK